MDDNTKKISQLVILAERERAQYGEATDDTINNLRFELEQKGIDIGSYSGMKYVNTGTNSGISTYGYGETHRIDKIWSYRVDKPSGGDAKPHVHVYKNGKQVGIENVDGTSSHGSSLKKVTKKLKIQSGLLKITKKVRTI